MMKNNLLLKLIREELDRIMANDIVNMKFIGQFSDQEEFLFNQYTYEGDNSTDMDYDEFIEDETRMKDFNEWMIYDFEYRFNKYKDTYQTLFRNGGGKMTLFREMYVPNEWIKSLQNANAKLGIYWSYEEDAAESHWGYGSGIKVLLQTSVKDEQIDWEGTFEANLHPSIGEDEKEIRLKENEKIPLDALWVKDKEIKLNKKIKSNIYLA